MVSSDFDTLTFEIWPEEYGGPKNSQAFSLRGVVLLLSVSELTGPVPFAFCSVFCLLLEQDVAGFYMSVSSIISPPEFGSSSIGGDIILQCVRGLKFSTVSRSKCVWLSSCNRWFSEDALCAKVWTNRLKTLHNSRKDLGSVRLVGTEVYG